MAAAVKGTAAGFEAPFTAAVKQGGCSEPIEQMMRERSKRKLEDAFGAVRDVEQMPDQATGSKAEQDDQVQRQRLASQQQASTSLQMLTMSV